MEGCSVDETEQGVDWDVWSEKTRRPKTESWNISTFNDWSGKDEPANGSEMEVEEHLPKKE